MVGLAKLADHLMDACMADPALNANAAVAKWHESQQKYGFKFLVTQLLGYLTGGPQRYTGQPMETAHKHLAITADQWQCFIADAGRVFVDLRMDVNTQTELHSILASFKDQCVVKQGEVAPRDPGMCRARPRGGAAYAQLGGVYPIALFADRLVEQVLQGDRVQVQWNRLDDAEGTRHPPGLKYMLTELLCHAAGGPEVVTSKGFDEAKLGIDPNQWAQFLALVGEAATLWPTKHHRDMVLKLCEHNKAEICFGLEGQETAASFDLPTSMDASSAQGFQMASKCPFSGKSGGQCPFSGKSASPAPSRTVLIAESGVNSTLQDCFTETAAGAGQAPSAGRVLGSSLQRTLDGLLEEDPDLCCPVSLMVFCEPVRASDGFIYDRAMLTQLLKNGQRSPMTREVLKPEHKAATEKMAEVLEFRHRRSEELLTFALEAAGHNPQMAKTALERAMDYLAMLQSEQARVMAAEAARIHAKLGQRAVDLQPDIESTRATIPRTRSSMASIDANERN